jgi:membrane protein DedA with SNARE-associated domain
MKESTGSCSRVKRPWHFGLAAVNIEGMFDLLGRMTDALSGLIDSPWLWVVVFVVAGLDALLPFMPSETTVVIVGVLIAPDPALLPVLIIVATVGAWAGDCLAYAIGRYSGPQVIARMMRSEQGRRRHDWAQALLRLHGSILIIAGRYIAGVRAVTMLTAGVLRYPTRQFLVTDAVGAGIWATYAALIGLLGGATFEDNPAMGMLLAFSIGLVLAALIEVARRGAAQRRSAGHRAAPTLRPGAPVPALACEVELAVPGPQQTSVRRSPTDSDHRTRTINGQQIRRVPHVTAAPQFGSRRSVTSRQARPSCRQCAHRNMPQRVLRFWDQSTRFPRASWQHRARGTTATVQLSPGRPQHIRGLFGA